MQKNADKFLFFNLYFFQGYAIINYFFFQITEFLESLKKLSTRLKNVNNPYNALLPVPVQISEAIMTFQENGPTLSSRVIFYLFIV